MNLSSNLSKNRCWRASLFARFGVALAVLVSMAAVARAQGTPTDARAAQALFASARSLMKAEKFDEACAKLAESQRLDPAAGTLLNLALCHEKQGKIATAWVEYNDVLGLSRSDGNETRRRISAERIHELATSLPHVVIAPPASAPLAHLVVRLDGAELGQAAFGVAIPVDPGAHRVDVVQAGPEGHWSQVVGPLAKGATAVVQIPALADAPKPQEMIERAPQPAEAGRSGDTRRKVSYLLASVGLVGVGAGTYFGLRAKADWDIRNDRCRIGCDRQAADAGARAHTFARLADGAFGLGVIAISVAGYLFLSRPPAGTAPEVHVGPSTVDGGFGVAYEGAF